MRNRSFLPPWVLQVFGMALIVGFSVHWWQSGQESALLIGVGATLATAGSVQGAYEKASRKLYKGNPPEEEIKRKEGDDS